MLADSWLIPLHSVWKAEEFVREFNLKRPVVQHLVKIDWYGANESLLVSKTHQLPLSAVCQLKATEQPPAHWLPNALLMSKEGHLPRGLRAAATLSPTFLRKFTLGSSDGPEALVSKNKRYFQFKASLSMTETCHSPVCPRSPTPGAWPQQPIPYCFPLSPSLGHLLGPFVFHTTPPSSTFLVPRNSVHRV